jgi:hypothetical protein
VLTLNESKPEFEKLGHTATNSWIVKQHRTKVYCILASCYIRLYNLQADTDNKHNIRSSIWLAHDWQHHIGKNWHNIAPASIEYTITPEDGHVRPKYVDD